MLHFRRISRRSNFWNPARRKRSTRPILFRFRSIQIRDNCRHIVIVLGRMLFANPPDLFDDLIFHGFTLQLLVPACKAAGFCSIDMIPSAVDIEFYHSIANAVFKALAK